MTLRFTDTAILTVRREVLFEPQYYAARTVTQHQALVWWRKVPCNNLTDISLLAGVLDINSNKGSLIRVIQNNAIVDLVGIDRNSVRQVNIEGISSLIV